MNDEWSFRVDEARVATVAKATRAESIEDAFPAALLAPTWLALLQGGALKTPPSVDASRVRIRVLGPTKLELLMPEELSDGDEVVKSVIVEIGRWTASGDIVKQFSKEAAVLERALDMARGQGILDHDGSGQKPHN